MSDMYWPSRDLEQTHEIKHLTYLGFGWAAVCWCGYGTGYRRFIFLAVLAHIRHKKTAMKKMWAA
jgi:hypothetical protein